MNPEKPSLPPDDFESKITALLLGELAPAEAEAVQRAIAGDPALAAMRDGLHKTVSFVRAAVAGPNASATAFAAGPRLSAKRRRQLLRRFKKVVPAEHEPRSWRWWRWAVPMSAAAAVILLVAGVALTPQFAAKTSAARREVALFAQLDDTAAAFGSKAIQGPDRAAEGKQTAAEQHFGRSVAVPAGGAVAANGRSELQWFMKERTEALTDEAAVAPESAEAVPLPPTESGLT